MGRSIYALLAICAGLVAPDAQAEALAADNADIFSASGALTVFHMYTGPDHASHVELTTLDAVTGKFGGAGFIDAGAERIKLGYTRDGATLGYHNADHRTLLVAVQGTMVFETGDGQSYRIAPGNVVLAEDHTGRGHSNRCEAPSGTRQCMILQVTLRDDETGLRPAPK